MLPFNNNTVTLIFKGKLLINKFCINKIDNCHPLLRSSIKRVGEPSSIKGKSRSLVMVERIYEVVYFIYKQLQFSDVMVIRCSPRMWWFVDSNPGRVKLVKLVQKTHVFATSLLSIH